MMTPPALPIDQYYQALNAKSAGGQYSLRIHTAASKAIQSLHS